MRSRAPELVSGCKRGRLRDSRAASTVLGWCVCEYGRRVASSACAIKQERRGRSSRGVVLGIGVNLLLPGAPQSRQSAHWACCGKEVARYEQHLCQSDAVDNRRTPQGTQEKEAMADQRQRTQVDLLRGNPDRVPSHPVVTGAALASPTTNSEHLWHSRHQGIRGRSARLCA